MFSPSSGSLGARRGCRALTLCVAVALIVAGATGAAAQSAAEASPDAHEQGQEPSAPPPPSRHAALERRQAEKAAGLSSYRSGRVERFFRQVDRILEGGTLRWHPFLDSAYNGGGVTIGAGRATYVGAYSYVDVRASYSARGYKRAEAELVVPRLFNRRGRLSAIGGWREATQVGFFGIGPDTSLDDRTNYRFQQPYGSVLLTLLPARKVLQLRGGVGFTQWSLHPGEGAFPAVEARYTPVSLPGLGVTVDYLHTHGAVALDWRTSPDYSRRGAFLGAALHDFADREAEYGLRMAEYEGIAHLPILRESWVLSVRGRVQSAFRKDGQEIPFFMLPSLGGGSTLRAFSSWRFRDRHSLLLQAEWRTMVNRYLDLALFYDAGKVAPRASKLDFSGLTDNYGVGLRFHGPVSTPLRIELARSGEARLNLIVSVSAAF
jgi:hypothetical protein